MSTDSMDEIRISTKLDALRAVDGDPVQQGFT